jgi:hypothetical protein
MRRTLRWRWALPTRSNSAHRINLGRPTHGKERRLVVRSLACAASQEKSLRQRVARAVTELNALDERKQGKPRLPDQAAAAILAKHRVEGLVTVTVTTDVHEHVKRRYGTRPATTVRSERVRVGARARRRHSPKPCSAWASASM